MWWLIQKLEEDLRKRRSLTMCKICGLLYNKVLKECSHCSGIDEVKLVDLLKKRAKFRIGLGKGMIVGALVVISILMIINIL